MASVFYEEAGGAGPLTLSFAAPAGTCRRVMGVTLHLSAAPVTAGSLTITLDAVSGGEYDALLKSVSLVGVTDYVWIPDSDLFIVGGDAVRVVYTNPDARVCGARVTLKAV